MYNTFKEKIWSVLWSLDSWCSVYVLAPAAAAVWKSMLEMQNLRLYSSPTESGPPFEQGVSYAEYSCAHVSLRSRGLKASDGSW